LSYNVDWPNAEYHEIIPNLFQGGHDWAEGGKIKGASSSTVSGDKSWDYVVSAYFLPREKSLPQCDTRFVLFDDTEYGLEEETWSRIQSAVDEVVDRWRNGQKVLIRCQAGYNRSGMIMALVLMRLGENAEDAIKRIRLRRGKHALVNKVFEDYVRQREQLYYDPSSWSATESLINELVP
jgi:protein-tyrosine phosphatase